MAPDRTEPQEPTRAARAWTGLAVGLVVLVFVLVFILQNTKRVPVHFLWFHWRTPLGVALLFAAVGGGLVTVLLGVVRITQLRRRNGARRRRNR